MVEKNLQPRIIMSGKAFMGAKGVGHSGQRLLQMRLQHVLVGNIIRHFAQAIHIIGDANQLGGSPGQRFKCPTHHGGASHFAKRANMRQA